MNILTLVCLSNAKYDLKKKKRMKIKQKHLFKKCHLDSKKLDLFQITFTFYE